MMPQVLDSGLSEEEAVILRHGFLPDHIPLKTLSDPYYRPWEDIAQNLPNHIAKGSIREAVDNLPLLSTEKLRGDQQEWRRAYVVLAFLLHAYIWGGEAPKQVCTANLHIYSDRSVDEYVFLYPRLSHR